MVKAAQFLSVGSRIVTVLQKLGSENYSRPQRDERGERARFAVKKDDEREFIKEEQIKHANLYSLIICVDTLLPGLDFNSLSF